MFSFFLIFIQLYDSRKIHFLTEEFGVKFHMKTDSARYWVYPRQVMDFLMVAVLLINS